VEMRVNATKTKGINMTNKRIVECDNCRADLTYIKDGSKFYLELAVVLKHVKGNDSSAYTNEEPPIDDDAHFCGLDCLASWLENKKK
jgi:hypothetical protein